MSDETPFEGVTSAHADAEGVTIVRIFNASRQELFDAWTKPEHFSKWFGENDSEISAENVFSRSAWRIRIALATPVTPARVNATWTSGTEACRSSTIESRMSLIVIRHGSGRCPTSPSRASFHLRVTTFARPSRRCTASRGP